MMVTDTQHAEFSESNIEESARNAILLDLVQRNTMPERQLIQELQKLMRNGARPIAQEENTRKTAVHIASERGANNLLKVLLPASAPDMIDAEYRTAKDMADNEETRALFQRNKAFRDALLPCDHQESEEIIYCESAPLSPSKQSFKIRSSIGSITGIKWDNTIKSNIGNRGIQNYLGQKLLKGKERWEDIYSKIKITEEKIGLLNTESGEHIAFTRDKIKQGDPVTCIAGELDYHQPYNKFSIPVDLFFRNIIAINTEKSSNIIPFIGFFPEEDNLDKRFELETSCKKYEIATSNLLINSHAAFPFLEAARDIEAYELLGHDHGKKHPANPKLFNKQGELISPKLYHLKSMCLSACYREVNLAHFIEEEPESLVKMLGDSKYLIEPLKDSETIHLKKIYALYQQYRSCQKLSDEKIDVTGVLKTLISEIIENKVTFVKRIKQGLTDKDRSCRVALDKYLPDIYKNFSQAGKFKKKVCWGTVKRISSCVESGEPFSNLKIIKNVIQLVFLQPEELVKTIQSNLLPKDIKCFFPQKAQVRLLSGMDASSLRLNAMKLDDPLKNQELVGDHAHAPHKTQKIHYAMNNTDIRIDRLIKFRSNQLLEGVKRNDAEKVKEHIKQGTPVTQRDKETGETGLHIASKHNYLEMVKLLLPVADPSVRNNDGNTAEDCAITLEMRQLFEDDRKTAADLDSDRFRTLFAYQDPDTIAYCDAAPLPLHHGPISQIKRSDIENKIKKRFMNKIQADKGNVYLGNFALDDSSQKQKLWELIKTKIESAQSQLGLLKIGKGYGLFSSDSIEKRMPLGFIAGEWVVHSTDNLVSNMVLSTPIYSGYSIGINRKNFTNIMNYFYDLPSQAQLDTSYKFHDEAIKSQVALANIIQKDQHIAVPVFYTTCKIDAFQLLGAHSEHLSYVDFRLLTKRGEAISPDAYDPKYTRIHVKQLRIDMLAFIESYPQEIIEVLETKPFLDALEKDTNLTEISAFFDPIRPLSRNKIRETSRQSTYRSKNRHQKSLEFMKKYTKDLEKLFLDNQESFKDALNSASSLWQDDFKKSENWETAFVVLYSVLTRKWIEAEKKFFFMEIQEVMEPKKFKIDTFLFDYKQVSKQLAEKFTREELKHWFPEVLHHIDRDIHNSVSDNMCASDREGDQAPTSEAVDSLSKAVKDCDILKVMSNKAPQTTILDDVPCPSQENKAPLKRIKAFYINLEYIQSDIATLIEEFPAKSKSIREIAKRMALNIIVKEDAALDSSAEAVPQDKSWLQKENEALCEAIQLSNEEFDRRNEEFTIDHKKRLPGVKIDSTALDKAYFTFKKHERMYETFKFYVKPYPDVFNESTYNKQKSRMAKYPISFQELRDDVCESVETIDASVLDAFDQICTAVLKHKFRNSKKLPRKVYKIEFIEVEEMIRSKKPKFILNRYEKKMVMFCLDKHSVCHALRALLDDEQIKSYFPEDIQKSVLEISREACPPNAKNSIQYYHPKDSKDWKMYQELISESEILYSLRWPKSREHCELKTVDEIGSITKRIWTNNMLFHPNLGSRMQGETEAPPLCASLIFQKTLIDKIKTTRSHLVLVHLKPTKKRTVNALTPEFCVMTLEKIHKGDIIDCISGALSNLPPATGNKFLLARSSAFEKGSSGFLDFTECGNITSYISYLVDSNKLQQDYFFPEEKDKDEIATSNLEVFHIKVTPVLRATRDILPGELLGFDNQNGPILLDKQGISIKPDKYVPQAFYFNVNGYTLDLVRTIEVCPDIIFFMLTNTEFSKQAEASGIALPKENLTKRKQMLLKADQRQERDNKLCEQVKKWAKLWAAFLKKHPSLYQKQFDGVLDNNLFSACEKEDKRSVDCMRVSLEKLREYWNQDTMFCVIKKDNITVSKIGQVELRSQINSACSNKSYWPYFFGDQVENKLSRDDQPSSKQACKLRR